MSYAILAQNEGYFAAFSLYRNLHARLYLKERDGRFGDIEYVRFSGDIKEKNIFLIGAWAFKKYLKFNFQDRKNIALIICDSASMKMRKLINYEVARRNMAVYCMPDKMKYFKGNPVPAYQTMTVRSDNLKSDGIVVMHSPGIKHYDNSKGTEQIETTLRGATLEHSFRYERLCGLSWENCVKEKSLAHIFVDQLIYKNPFCFDFYKRRFGVDTWTGGLGKSGLEAMLLKSCVVVGAERAKTEPYFPSPPVVWTDYNLFKTDMLRLLTDTERTKRLAEQQYEWAAKYLSPQFVVKNITRHLR